MGTAKIAAVEGSSSAIAQSAKEDCVYINAIRPWFSLLREPLQRLLRVLILRVTCGVRAALSVSRVVKALAIVYSSAHTMLGDGITTHSYCYFAPRRCYK